MVHFNKIIKDVYDKLSLYRLTMIEQTPSTSFGPNSQIIVSVKSFFLLKSICYFAKHQVLAFNQYVAQGIGKANIGTSPIIYKTVIWRHRYVN